MKLKEMDRKQFAKTLAVMADCPSGAIFVEWLDEQIKLDSYDAINPHNTSRNEGYRAAFRDIRAMIDRGRDPKSYPEEANT